MVQDYKDLRVWHDAVALAREVYTLTAHFPRDELFGLTSQMKRSAVSVASNIAEGSKRRTTKELIQFLHIADGSLAELETQLQIAIEIKLAHAKQLADIPDRINKLSRSLTRLKSTLRQKSAPRSTIHDPRSTPI